jgi:hypothetical protein
MRNLAVVAFTAALAFAGAGAKSQDKTFKPDGEGYLKNWLLLEPIALGDAAAEHTEESQKAFFDKDHFENQKKATPKEGDKVKVGGAEMKWHSYAASETIVDFEAFCGGISKDKDKALFLGVVYVVCEAEMADVVLSIGSDDSSLWRLNGKEIIRVYAGRGVEADQDRSGKVTLNKGVNVLSMAVINGEGPTGACARFFDKDNKPVKNVTLTLTPPAEGLK